MQTLQKSEVHGNVNKEHDCCPEHCEQKHSTVACERLCQAMQGAPK